MTSDYFFCQLATLEEMAELGLKIVNKFATCVCMATLHFECAWLIGEEICLSRLYHFAFNIYPLLFLQEIAILFIYYLFWSLLDLIEHGNEKSSVTMGQNSDDFLFFCLQTQDEP